MEVTMNQDLYRVTVTEYDDGAQRPCPELTKIFTEPREADAYAKVQSVTFSRSLFYRAEVQQI